MFVLLSTGLCSLVLACVEPFAFCCSWQMCCRFSGKNIAVFATLKCRLRLLLYFPFPAFEHGPMWLEVTSPCNTSAPKPALQQSEVHLVLPHQPLHQGLWTWAHGCCALQLSRGCYLLAEREQEASWEDSSTPCCPNSQAA